MWLNTSTIRQYQEMAELMMSIKAEGHALTYSPSISCSIHLYR